MFIKDNPIYRLTKAKKPTIYIEFPLVLGLVLIGFVLLVGWLVYFYPSTKKPADKKETSPTPTVAQDYHQPNGKIYGVSGTVTKITSNDEISSSPSASVEDFEIETDSKNIFTVSLRKDVPIYIYSLGTGSQSPNLLNKNGQIADIKVGVKVYVSSQTDLTGKKTLTTKDVSQLDLYLAK